MPDDDIVPRKVRGPWRKVAKGAIGFQPAQDVANQATTALAKDLRDFDIPSCGGLIRALRDSEALGDEDALPRAVAQFRHDGGEHRLALQFIAEAERLSETRQGELAAMTESEVGEQLLTGALRRHAEAAAFGPEGVTREMLNSGDISISDVTTYKRAVLGKMPLAELAKDIASKPSSKIKAPRRERQTTAEILHKGID